MNRRPHYCTVMLLTIISSLLASSMALAGPESDAAIKEVIAILEARKSQIEDAREKQAIDQAISRLQGLRKPEAGNLEPKLVNLKELTNASYDPWVSEDGLTIYYTVGDSIWQAARKDVNSPFANPRRLLPGRMPTLTEDGLQIVLLRPGRFVKESLHLATRSKIDHPFGEPQEIAYFNQIAAKSPALSDDGLTLLFNRPKRTGQGVEVVASTRKDTESQWADPKPVHISADRAVDTELLLWPFLTADGKTLFVTQGASIFVAKKQSEDMEFNIGGTVPLPSSPKFTIVRSPRYIPKTKELFFSATTGDRNNARWTMWVLKNYEP